jgi:hypothetical protein
MSSQSLRTGLVAFALLIVFMAQILSVVRRESMTFDEGYHTYAGFRYWQCADFGVNPEHPPLAKLVAALPLWLAHTPVPAGNCPVEVTSKDAGYGASTAWFFGAESQAPRIDFGKVLWTARLTMSLFAMTLAVTAFFFTRRLFGDASALAALGLIAFEPTLIAHGALVTTDMAVSSASLLAVFAFFCYQRRPGALRLLLAGLACGLTLSVKHSGVLILPVLVVLACVELFYVRRAPLGRVVARQALGLVVIFGVGFAVLWSTYLFRYAARPHGVALSMSLADFIADTIAKQNRSFMLHVIPVVARFHLLPEAYLYGFVDVLSISNPGQSSFLLGHLYPHGVPRYFPLVVLIKTTLGMLALGVLAVVGVVRKELRVGLRALYLLAPAVVWMVAGMGSTLNIGYRHVLPIVAPMCCLLGAAAVAMWHKMPRLRVVIAVLVGGHVVSSVAVFPKEMAYANEVAGGPGRAYKLLTDSNDDWGQALPQLAQWLQQHDAKDCWLAFDGVARPESYGVRCRYLTPNGSDAKGDPPPAVATGTFVISGLSWSGIEWERPDLNPYEVFRASKPVAVVGGADIVYQGTYDMSRVVAVHRTIQAMNLNNGKKYAEALPLAQAAVAALPTSALAHLQLANALKGGGRRGEAHAEYAKAEEIAAAQPEWYFLQRPEIRAGVRDTQ